MKMRLVWVQVTLEKLLTRCGFKYWNLPGCGPETQTKIRRRSSVEVRLCLHIEIVKGRK